LPPWVRLPKILYPVCSSYSRMNLKRVLYQRAAFLPLEKAQVF